MRLKLEITTRDRDAEFDLFNTTTTHQDLRAHLAAGVVAKYEGTLLRKSGDFPSVINLGFDFGVGVAGSLVASAVWDWLKNNLKTRPEQIEIDRKIVEFEEGEIKRVIEERIRITR